MQVVVAIFALMSFVVAALPTAPTSAPGNGRGATIFTAPNGQGESTAIPGNAWCTDLNNIFGNFDGKVRSIMVEKGFRCQFHVNYGCPANGRKYEFGSKDLALSVGTLPEWLDQKVHSVYCAQA